MVNPDDDDDLRMDVHDATQHDLMTGPADEKDDK